MANYSNIAVQTTITGAIVAGDLTLTVADATGYPAVPFRIVLDPGVVASEEVCQVTAKVSTLFTVTRGYDGTTAKSHSSGATVIHAVVASDLTDLQAADTTEASARASADTALSTAISNEATTRATADTTLQTNIGSEASTRLAADLLRLLIANNLSDLNSASAARTNLGLGSLAVLSSITASLISDASANGRSLITAADYAAMKTLLGLVIGTNVQAWDADLDTLAGMGSTRAGLLAALPAFIQSLLDDVDAATARATLGAGTGNGSVTSVNITQPAAGITASGGPVTTSGAITLALADDLAAVEALASTGVAQRTGANTWSVGNITESQVTSLVADLAAKLAAASNLSDVANATTARGNLSAAPKAATYITQTADSELTAEQALSSLASGYVKNTTGTGVLSVQAAPIPAADGGALAQGRPKQGATTYYGIPGAKITAGSAGGITVNRLRFSPFRVPTAIIVDAIALTITTGSAATNARCGVYAATTDLQPSGAPLFDTGNISLASSGQVVTVLGSPVTLPAGIYLQAINVDSGTPSIRSMKGFTDDVIDPGSANPAIDYLYLTAGVAFGALPSSPTWDNPAVGTGVSYWFALRISTP